VLCTYHPLFAIAPLQAVKLNRERMVVVLETTIYIYGLKDLKQLHTIDATFPNPKGICALSCSRDPAGTVLGDVFSMARNRVCSHEDAL
jgi:hypothetical protein